MCDYRMLDCCTRNCPCACACSNGQPRNGLQSCVIEFCDSALTPKAKIPTSPPRTRADNAPAPNKWQGPREYKSTKKSVKKVTSKPSIICTNMSNSKVAPSAGKNNGKKGGNKSGAAAGNAMNNGCACPSPSKPPSAENQQSPQKSILVCKLSEEIESDDSHSSDSTPETYMSKCRKGKSRSLTSASRVNQLKAVNDMKLEEMQKGIEQALRAYFMHTMEKIECLSTQLLRNECMVAKLHLDVVERIAKLNERNLTQFQVLSDRVNRMPVNTSPSRREIEKSFWSSESTRDEFNSDCPDPREGYTINDFDNLSGQKTHQVGKKNSKMAACTCYTVQQDQIASAVSATSMKDKCTEVEKFPTQHLQAKRPRRAFPIKAQPSLQSVVEESPAAEYITCEQRVQELQQELECSKQELKRSMKRLQQFKQREEIQLDPRDSKLSNMQMEDFCSLNKSPSSSLDSNKLSCSLNIDCGTSKKDTKKQQPIDMCLCASQSKVSEQQQSKQQRSNRQNSKQDHANVQYVSCPNQSPRNRKQSKNRNR